MDFCLTIRSMQSLRKTDVSIKETATLAIMASSILLARLILTQSVDAEVAHSVRIR